ncbi:MAG: AMP-binding protein [Verrucomicrobia bacterium]|nr:AMP-binding protein [Verrucomicrobiota bacterium]
MPAIAEQLAQLQTLLASLRANPFYRRKLTGTGVLDGTTSVQDFTARCPFTTKAELLADQAAHLPYGTNLTFARECYTRCHQTSGSGGAPLRWLDTPESWDWMLGNWEQIYGAAGVTRADRIFFAFSFGPFLGFWTAFEAALKLGCLCLPGGGLGSAARLRAMIENEATVLCCTPTYAIRLAEVAREEKIDPTTLRIKKIIVAGEPGGSVPAVRARIEQLWPGARVWDHHGMTEVGPVTYECPARPGVLHVIENSYLAEIVHPATGQPAAVGETGELILTTLGRIGSPLLRYRTGDLVKAASRTDVPCVCGRHELALEGGILARTDDMLVVRGVNIYPAAVEEIIHRTGQVAEYQVEVRTQAALTELLVRVEPRAASVDAVALAQELARDFQIAFALRIPVEVVAPGSLPRFEMKARRWLRIGAR